MRVVLLAENDDRGFLRELARAQRVHVREHAREVSRSVKPMVPLGVERRKVDADVSEAAERFEPRGAVGREVRGVRQDRDGQPAREEETAPLFEEGSIVGSL